MTLRWVRKRDGRRVPFDPRKVGESIGAAARSAGEEARVPNEEIAEITALFLEQRFRDRIPETSDLEDLVEKALLETGHARTAAVYAERIKARAKTRLELVVQREGAPVAPDGEPLLQPPGEPWADAKIVASLERRRVPAAVAEEVSAAVEQKVFGLGWKRIPASLVRELVNAELAERGMSAHIGRPHELVVPSEEVRKLLIAAYVRRAGGAPVSSPGGAESAVGQDVLVRFALAEIYPPNVADAHLEGRIHIQDLGRPLRLTAAAVALDALKARTPVAGRPAASDEEGAADASPGVLDGPRTLGELGARLSRTLALLAETHARVVVIPYANVFLAPFLSRKDAAARKELVDWMRLLPSSGVRPTVRLHMGPVPQALSETPVVGPRGRRWKATYGELGPQAERTARLMVEAILEDAASRPGSGTPGIGGADGHRAPGIGVILGLPRGGGAHFTGLTGRGGLAAPFVGVALEGPGLEPQRSRGLASVAELTTAVRRGTPIASGAAGVVAINCARAAQVAGPGDEPTLRREIFQAADLAIEALAAKWAFLEPALYRPKLPLWEQGGRVVGADSGKGDAPRAQGLPLEPESAPPMPLADRPPWERATVDADLAVQVVGLVGFSEAIERVLGEPSSANLAVAAAAGELLRALAARLREQGARRGLKVRLEEPELERGRRRLTDLDLVRTGGAAAGGASPRGEEADLRYSHGLGGALVDALYAPIGVAPFLEGGDLSSRTARLLNRVGAGVSTSGAAEVTA